MSHQVRLTSVDYVVFVHATEDFSKVVKAVENLMPPKLRERKTIEVEDVSGHYDNPIRIAKVSFRNPEDAIQVLTWIWRGLSDIDKAYMMRNLDLHLDERLRLYMRLDKQDAYLGSIKLSFGDDVIKVVFSFKGSKEAIKDLLLKIQ
ncbi:MAG: RNA-binding domain-containing protein [Candidatus Nezhaarchaeota archaeon]|nr:RNA-binding domain-containing protein [Candidatus Nezhaarchaeota archaeon]